jgi:hypothetical protein
LLQSRTDEAVLWLEKARGAEPLVERFQIVNRLCEDVQSTRYVV